MRKFLKSIYKYWLVRSSGLVDQEYYLRNNPDVTQNRMGSVWHYLHHGWRKGRNPNEYFDTEWYLRANPDVVCDSINPLYHYLKYGWKSNRDPSKNFSTELYLKANPDVKQSVVNPLVHFIKLGRAEGRVVFSAASYHINESELGSEPSKDKIKKHERSDRVYTLSSPLDEIQDLSQDAPANTQQGKLIMTLWVRDEIDIIEHNIKFHLKQGVDFIIATNNGSKDGTREILDKYQKRGLLHLIDELTHNQSQALCVNRMARMAIDDYGATCVFHCDADEFWCANSGNLKNEISTSEKEVLKANVINVLLYDKDGEEAFPEDAKFAVVRPIIPCNYIEDSKRVNLFYFRYQPSVIFRGYHEVTKGNHTVTDISETDMGPSKDIVIYHYPLRSKEQFYRKVINGGSAYKANKVLKKSQGFHFRRWYEAYQNGQLDQAYKELILNDNVIGTLMEKGMVKEIPFNEIVQSRQHIGDVVL